VLAALDLATGVVMSDCYRRHRHQELLRSPRLIDQSVPAELGIHLVPDNYGTHKLPMVNVWVVPHPCFQGHFTPPF